VLTPNVKVQAGEVELAMLARDPVPCRCGGRVVVATLLIDDNESPAMVGTIMHSQPTCPPYDRLGVRDYYDYLCTGREPAPVAVGGETPKSAKGRR
jgi:hypothetical protein